MKRIVVVALALLASACALPDTAVRTGSPRPQLAVKGAPADALLIVDGIPMGPASQFDGNPKVLIVEEGSHQVEIQRGGKAVHSEKAFVSNGETRTITINAGAR
jgi:hypothetical protein